MKKNQNVTIDKSLQDANIIELLQLHPTLLRSDVRKNLYWRRTKQVMEFVKNIVGSTSSPDHSLYALLELIKNPNITEEQNVLRDALPILLNTPFSPSKKGQQFSFNKSKSLKALQKAEQYYSTECYIQFLMDIISKDLCRSDTQNIKFTAFSEDELINNLQKRIQNCYVYFYEELKYTSYPDPKQPKCEKKIVKTVLQSYWLYPFLPYLFTINAIFQVGPSPQKKSKSDLILSRSHLPALDSNSYATYLIYQHGLRLLKNIQKALVEELAPIYSPSLLPCKEGCAPSRQWGFSYECFESGSAENNAFKSREQYFKSRKEFVLPICNTDKLAADLAAHFQLTFKQTANLRQQLPSYILKKQYGPADIQKEYGDQFLGIIKAFRILADPENYYKGTSFDKIFLSAVSESKDKSFFPAKCRKDLTDFKSICRFIFLYFKFISPSKRLLFQSIPEYPLYGNRIYPNFCDQLLDAFNEYVEENYINFYALNSHLKNSLKNLNPQSEPAFKSNVLPSIEQSLTVQNAINTLENHFKDLPNKSNHSDGIKTIINKYFAEHKIPKYPVSLNDGHYVWLYQRLLHLCFNIVGHYGVALLIHCTADRNESDKAE